MEQRLDYTKFNSEVKDWSVKVRQDLLNELNQLGIKQTGNLLRTLNASTKEYFGQTSKVQFRFPRYGVFVEKGVGRGYKINGVGAGLNKINGQHERAFSNKVSSRKLILTRKGRVPKPWFNPVIDQRIDQLSEIVSNNYEDLVINAVRLRIK